MALKPIVKNLKPLIQKPIAKPATADSTVKEPLKAIRIVVDMNDGTSWVAEGVEADAIWHYQMECEQLANASGTMPSYLGPGLKRVPKQ